MRRPSGETLRARRIDGSEHGRPRANVLLGQATAYVGRCQQAETRMMVLGVVPGKEDVAVGRGVLD